MMNNRQGNNYSYQNEQERRASFVVDLRRPTAVPEPVKKTAKTKKVAPVEKTAVDFSELTKAVTVKAAKKFRLWKREARSVVNEATRQLAAAPDLLASLSPKKKRFSWLKISQPRRRRGLRLFKKKSAWEEFVSQRYQDFQQAFSSARRSRRFFRERAEKTENLLSWYRSIFSFIVILVAIILPFKALSYFKLLQADVLEEKIINRSRLAIDNLLSASAAVMGQNYQAADRDFRAAAQDFLAAQGELGEINDGLLSLAALSDNPKLKLAAESKHFLRAGAAASSLGSNLVLASDSLFNNSNQAFSQAFDSFLSYGQAAADQADLLDQELQAINLDNLPSEYRVRFSGLAKQASFLSHSLKQAVSSGRELKTLFGATHDRRYLLVFQNNSELRASGGFIGSYALLDVRDGRLRSLEVPGGGSYDTEGGMRMLVAAPAPLWLVNPLWHFWDANWWPDWPTTAQNLMWFYEKSGGPTVDGVISVTPDVVESLLAITGPIDLQAEYGVTIDAANFWETTQRITERDNLAKTHPEIVADLATSSAAINSAWPIEQDLERNSDNKPKKIIGDLMVKIMEVLPQKMNKDSLPSALALLQEDLASKQILFYFRDPELQAQFNQRSWSGVVKPAPADYLLVVDTNIAGQKTDRKITEEISHESTVAPDGRIINTVMITRTHAGQKNEALTGVRNVDWLRVYVPAGSELISATGFEAPAAEYLQERPDPSWENLPLLAAETQALSDPESGTKIYQESGKTVFANWLLVDPGESATVVLRYRLPFTLVQLSEQKSFIEKVAAFFERDQADLLPYSLLVQKQPGAKPAAFTSRLSLPAGSEITWHYPETLGGQAGWEISDQLGSDRYFSIIIKR